MHQDTVPLSRSPNVKQQYRSSGGVSFLSSFSSAKGGGGDRRSVHGSDARLPSRGNINEAFYQQQQQQQLTHAGGSGSGVPAPQQQQQQFLPSPDGASMPQSDYPSMQEIKQNDGAAVGGQGGPATSSSSSQQDSELWTRYYSSQKLLQEAQEREKSLQYKIRVIESEVQTLRRVRPALVVKIGKNRLDPRTKKFVQYEVCVERTSAVPSQGVTFALWRRYSHFKDLQKGLVKESSSSSELKAAIPVLPGGKVFGNMEQEFILKRKQALEWYLQQLCAVEPLRRSEAFRRFLSSNSGSVLGGDVAAGEHRDMLYGHSNSGVAGSGLTGGGSDPLIMGSTSNLMMGSAQTTDPLVTTTTATQGGRNRSGSSNNRARDILARYD